MLTFTADTEARQMLALIGRGLTLRLYVNDIAPGRAHTAEVYVEPPEASGYRAADIHSWDVRDRGNGTEATAPPHAFRFHDEAGAVRGYYLTDSEGHLVGAEALDKPAHVERGGGSLTVTPSLTIAGI